MSSSRAKGLNQLYMFRATKTRQSSGSLLWLCCHRSAAISVHCTESCKHSQECSWGWTSLSPETCRADLERWINGICCIVLVAYVIILMMHGITNIKYFEIVPKYRVHRNKSHFWWRHCSGCGGDTVMGVVSLISCGLVIFRWRHGLVGRTSWFRCRNVFQEQWICDRDTKSIP